MKTAPVESGNSYAPFQNWCCNCGARCSRKNSLNADTESTTYNGSPWKAKPPLLIRLFLLASMNI